MCEIINKLQREQDALVPEYKKKENEWLDIQLQQIKKLGSDEYWKRQNAIKYKKTKPKIKKVKTENIKFSCYHFNKVKYESDDKEDDYANEINKRIRENN